MWIQHYCYPLFSECGAGYYRNGDDCEMCTGLSIKMDAGDDTNCSTECTGISDIPNTNHTACSKLCLKYFVQIVLNKKFLQENKIKKNTTIFENNSLVL